MASKYRPVIEEIATRHGLNFDVVEAVIAIESSGNTRAYREEPNFWIKYLAEDPFYKDKQPSVVSASYGLMQIMYPVARERGFTGEPESLYIPEIGIEYGCRHLRYLMNWATNNYDTAIAAYNGGKGGNSKPPYRNAAYLAKFKRALLIVRGSYA